MDQSKWKRAFALVTAILLIAAFGCGKAALDAEQPAEDPAKVVSIDSGNSAGADTAAAEHSGIYTVDGSTETLSDGTYASSSPYENAVLVQNAGQLKMASADINKTGDAKNDFSDGINAAVAVLSKGQMTLSDSNITTSAFGAFGCSVSGTGSELSVSGSYVYTSGDSSPALVVTNGGSATVTGGILSTEGMDSACLMLSGGSATLSGVTLKTATNEFLRVFSGKNTLTLDATTISANPILGADALLQLKLINGASFTGELGAELPAKVSVSLDVGSKLSLTAETYVSALVDADTTFQNIQSNGFSLYYDSNAPENAYLNSQSFQLPGGGFLSPII
ncbi:MAG: hypothetical protein LLF75_13000 [Eubacteriales bacterium]|nr:hypothetical protein [Eubacteriales bacterium]